MSFYKLIQGDCFQVLPTIEDESIDLVLTDPPYGVGKEGWDNLSTDWISEIYRVLKKTGSFYTFGSVWWYPYFHIEAIKQGFIPKNILCWYYKNGISRFKTNYQIEFDPIGFFVKSENYTFNLDDVRVPYLSTLRLKNKIVKDGKVWKPNPLGKMRGNVIETPVLAGARFKDERTEHPTQKPEALLEPMIKASSNKGDLILDPFLGSGTTMAVAKKLGRSCIGIEINPSYCDIVEKRCRVKRVRCLG